MWGWAEGGGVAWWQADEPTEKSAGAPKKVRGDTHVDRGRWLPTAGGKGIPSPKNFPVDTTDLCLTCGRVALTVGDGSISTPTAA